MYINKLPEQKKTIFRPTKTQIPRLTQFFFPKKKTEDNSRTTHEEDEWMEIEIEDDTLTVKS